MANSLSEGFVRFTYSSELGVHHGILPVNFEGTPTPGTNPTMTLRDASTAVLTDAWADFIAVYRGLFNEDTIFGLVEAYTVNPTTQERTFIYAFNAATAGNSAFANVPLTQLTMTFKTVGGGVLRIVAMEGITNPNQKFLPPYAVDGYLAALSNFIVGNDSMVIGRDDTFAFAPISATSKISDVLRKRAGLG